MERVEYDGFESQFSALFRRARNVARRMVANDAVAEELAAEALARAWVQWDAIADGGSPEAWVVRVTTNLAIDTLRARKLPPEREQPDDDIADGRAVRDALVEALASLPDRQRDAVVLRHLAGLSATETAEALGVTRSTASVHLHRGQRSLREQLAQNSISPSVKRPRSTNVNITSTDQARAAMTARTVVTGRATAIVKGGLAVDIGMAGYLPASAVDLQPVDSLDLYVGRELDVVVTGIGQDGMPILSRSAALESPEDKQRRRDALESMPVGTRLSGTVTQLVAFGAFLDLGKGVRGLVHSSELGDRSVSIGDVLDVEVDAISVDAERVSLTLGDSGVRST